MSWSTIAATEVLEEFTPQEKTAINAIQGASTQLAAILARAVNAWRGAIRSGGGAVSSTASTIPDQIRMDVIAQARWRWLIAMPSLKALQTKERSEAASLAEKRFDDIARGNLRVESPTADESTAPAPRFSTTERERTYRRETDQDGL